jgi:aminoglycoside phosphotransferase (APT) family kinase protein
MPDFAVPDVRPEDLGPVLEAAVGWPGRVTSLIVEPIPYRVWNRASGGVFRVNVSMAAGGMAPPLVLKVVRHRPWTPTKDDLRSQLDDGGDAPSDIAWWRREAEAFKSGLTKAYGPPFRAVRCHHVQERGPAEYWLWLERAAGTIGYNWPPETLDAAARALGKVQAGLGGIEPPSWLARPLATLESTKHRAELLTLFDDKDTWRHPVVQAFVTPEMAKLAQRAWARFDQIRARLSTFDRILNHGDLGPFNAFAAADGTFTAIDWAMVRMGPRGEDLAALVLSTVGTPQDADGLAATEDRAIAAYVAGLRAGGWQGDERDVRFTYRAFGLAQLGLLIGLNAHKAMDAGWIASKGEGFDLMADMSVRFAISGQLLDRFAADPIGQALLA